MSSEKFPYNSVRFRYPRHRQGRECSRLRCYHPQWSCNVHHTGSKSRNRYCSQHCSNLKRKKSSFPFLYPFLSLVLISTLYKVSWNIQANSEKNIVKKFWQNFFWFSVALARHLLTDWLYSSCRSISCDIWHNICLWAIFMPKNFFLVWHDICCVKIGKIRQKRVISRCYISTYVKFGAPALP